jgi:Asp-tRNA(Asn)/Glu-tRNA(Gln) amidotransferase A subunit family amidase
MAGDFELHEADATDLVRAIETSRVTSEALTRSYLARIAAFDKAGPAINAIISINDHAIDDARALDVSLRREGLVGPLHGVPVLLKDNFDTACAPTTAGSLALGKHRPAQDAYVVKRLKKAGAIILGKANLHELALGGTTASSLGGQTRNPYDLERTPGGSSGGTGAAVAANFCAAGMGSDTVNSIRSPASAQNLVGFRPTRGLVGRSGVVPVSPTQDVVGPIARSVRDAARMLDAIAGYDAADAATAWSAGRTGDGYFRSLDRGTLDGLRIGICTCLFGRSSEHDDVNRVVMSALALMEKCGARLVDMAELDLDVPSLVEELDVQKYEFKDAIDAYLSRSPGAPVRSLDELIASQKFLPGIGDFLHRANAVQAFRHDADYCRRRVRIAALQDTLMGAMAGQGVDMLAYPLQRRLAAPIADRTQPERNGIVAGLSGFPAIDVPAGFSSATRAAPVGVPIGLDLLGRPWSEQMLLDAAFALETASRVRVAPRSTPAL